jgi:hypothetical protein
VDSNASQEQADYIFRVEVSSVKMQSDPGSASSTPSTDLTKYFLGYLSNGITILLISTLKMEAAHFSKMLVFTYKTMRYHKLEDYKLKNIFLL